MTGKFQGIIWPHTPTTYQSSCSLERLPSILTERFMLGVGKLCVPDINGLTVDLVRPTSIVTENRYSLRHILSKNNVKRLAVVPRINRGQYVLVTLTKIAQLPEKDSSLLWCEISPFRACPEGCTCCGDCRVDVLLAGGFYFGDDGLIVRVDGLDLLSGGSGHEFIVDEETWVIS